MMRFATEIPMRYVDYTDRSTCVLFSDGAVAPESEIVRNRASSIASARSAAITRTVRFGLT
jgi:3-oxoacyl-[acyl-carrier-protein] synthase III